MKDNEQMKSEAKMKKQWVIAEQRDFPSGSYFECVWGPYDDEWEAARACKSLYQMAKQQCEFTVVELVSQNPFK